MAFLDKNGVITLWGRISALFSRKTHNHTYVPEGEVSAPAITVSTGTVSVNEITSVGTLPVYTAPQFVDATLSHNYDEEDELVTLVYVNSSFSQGSFDAGTLPTFAAKSVVNTVNAEADKPVFTGITSETTASIDKTN